MRWTIDIEGVDPDFPLHLKHITKGKIWGDDGVIAYYIGMRDYEAREILEICGKDPNQYALQHADRRIGCG